MESSLTIRHMSLEEFKIAMAWANEEDWIFSETDAEAFYSLDPNGYFIGEVNGGAVGCLIAINYGEYTFLDIFLVRPEHRGKGYGTQLLAHALEYGKTSKTIGVEATQENVKYWPQFGFKEYYHILCFCKQAEGTLHKDLVDLRKDVPFELLAEYDLQVFGYDRRKFLELFLQQKGYYALGAMKDGKLIGYGILRKLHTDDGYVVGPLSADSPDVAKQILDGLQSFVPGETVHISRFNCNKDANEIISKTYGWENVTDEARLYKGGEPKTDMSKTYVPIEEFS